MVVDYNSFKRESLRNWRVRLFYYLYEPKYLFIKLKIKLKLGN